MSVFSGPALKERVYPLIATGEHVATLSDLTFETGGTYGDALLWKWLLAPLSDATAYYCRDDGNEKIHHEYSSPDVIVGSKPHEWIASLSGKVLAEGDEPPDAEDLVGKRMVVYIAHQAPKQGPNVGKLRERFVQGSTRAFDLVPPKTYAKNVVRPEPTEGGLKRAALVEELERQIGRAVKLKTPNCVAYVALDLADGDTDQLEQLIATVQAEVQTALDA